MTIRVRDFLYALAVSMVAVLAMLAFLAAAADAQSLSLMPPPIEAGGAMVVQWSGITHPTTSDWIGLYAPGSSDRDYITFIYVGCWQRYYTAPPITRASGTCGMPIPGTVAAGPYELRLFAENDYTLLSISPTFQIFNGGGR